MIRFYYGPDGKGKLVRDTLDKKICSEKHIVKSRFLPKKELAVAILDKLPEEIQELKVADKVGNQDDIKEELADVLTLIRSYINIQGYEAVDIEKVVDEKVTQKGAYEKGTFIEYVELNPNGDDYDFWLKHFRDNSDRYIEEKKHD